MNNGVSDEVIALLDHIFEDFGLGRFRIQAPAIHVCERNWSWNPPVFSDFDFWLVFDGRGELRINGEPYPLRKGAGFLMQPGDRVTGRHDPDAPLTVFACHFELAEGAGDGGRLSQGVLHFWEEEPETMRRRAREAIRWNHAPAPANALARPILMELVMRGLLGCSGPGAAVVPDALAELALEIRARPGEEWAADEMARRCCLSIPHFNRQFRKAFGESPRRFVIAQRIRRAGQLLRESQLPILQIAESLGYGDVFFFYRQFKAVMGKTPMQVREEVAAEP